MIAFRLSTLALRVGEPPSGRNCTLVGRQSLVRDRTLYSTDRHTLGRQKLCVTRPKDSRNSSLRDSYPQAHKHYPHPCYLTRLRQLTAVSRDGGVHEQGKLALWRWCDAKWCIAVRLSGVVRPYLQHRYYSWQHRKLA